MGKEPREDAEEEEWNKRKRIRDAASKVKRGAYRSLTWRKTEEEKKIEDKGTACT